MKICAALLIFLAIQVFPQQREATNERELKRQSEHALAVSIVEQTVAEAPLWDDRKSASEVLADAADISWERTPGSAKRWLIRAWELIDSISEELQDPSLKEFFTNSNKAELQSGVLRVAHAHDPKLAETLIQSLETKEPEEKKDRGAFDDRTARSEQFLRLAQQAVETNPELAFTLAQRSLADGISFTLQNVMTSLRRKNADLSNRLFDLALARFSASATDPSEAEVLAGYLFQPGLTFSTNSSGVVIMSMNPMQRNEPVVAQAEPQRARAFLVAAYQAFLSRPAPIETPEAKARAQKIWAFGQRNLGRYNTYATEFAGPARDFLARLQSQLFPEGRGDPFSSRQSKSGDTSAKPTEKELYEARLADLEERADKETNPTAKKQAYVNAVLAVEATDYERAKRIAEKIDDDDLRADTISYVLYRAALAFVTAKDVDSAQELASKVTHTQRRAMVKIAIAQRLLSNKAEQPEPNQLTADQQRAYDLLNDVARDLMKESPSKNAAKLLLARAALLATLDRAQALVSLEDALRMINKLDTFELKDAAAPALGLSLAPRSARLADTPRLGFSFPNVVRPLIETDFEALTDLAARFDRKEVRGVARFEVAKLYLQSTKP